MNRIDVGSEHVSPTKTRPRSSRSSRVEQVRVGSSPPAWGTHRALVFALARNRFIPTCVGNTMFADRSRRWRTFIPTCVGNTQTERLDSVAAPVHPHVRGEHILACPGVAEITGSSPRAWGTHPEHHPRQSLDRFIPTCVGNTVVSGLTVTETAVHPHVRGEHETETSWLAATAGSSPRAWGTRKREEREVAARRFIPTCVGNTPARPGPCCRSPVHPHVRGEHAQEARAAADRAGSSPRAWGTRSSNRSRWV